jgi:uncharacterized protein YndB with AHSA1/START domain
MAHEPEALLDFKWPVRTSRTIAAPPGRVWEVISSPGLMPLYHPFCQENRVLHWPGSGSRDEIHYFSGWVLQRNIIEWIEGVGLDLEIGRSGGRTSTVTWRIADRAERRSELRITVYPHALQHLPVLTRWIPHLISVRPQLNRYLDSVVRGLDWFISAGEPVRRNQFGSHSWFSPPIEARSEGSS